jgi:peptidoglycan/LPS O-acetylase OafA/YrhL
MKKHIIEIDINKILSISRFFAILSVIIAHAHIVNLGTVSIITERLGSIGVVLFFFISGYYFKPKQDVGIGVFF